MNKKIIKLLNERKVAIESYISSIEDVKYKFVKSDKVAELNIGLLHAKLDEINHLINKVNRINDNINRVEIVDEGGRRYVNRSIENCIIDFQDGDKTLKLFIKNDV